MGLKRKIFKTEIVEKPITDATAVPSDVAKGKVFYNNNGRQVGSGNVYTEKNFTISVNDKSSNTDIGTLPKFNSSNDILLWLYADSDGGSGDSTVPSAHQIYYTDIYNLSEIPKEIWIEFKNKKYPIYGDGYYINIAYHVQLSTYGGYSRSLVRYSPEKNAICVTNYTHRGVKSINMTVGYKY